MKKMTGSFIATGILLLSSGLFLTANALPQATGFALNSDFVALQAQVAGNLPLKQTS